MADSKLSALAAGTPAPADLLYLVQNGVSKKTTVADLRNSGPLDLAGGAVTTSDPVIDAAQTWNAAGVTFTGIKFNVTDTASAAGSLLMDLQVGGESRFSVNAKSGQLSIVKPNATGFGEVATISLRAQKNESTSRFISFFGPSSLSEEGFIASDYGNNGVYFRGTRVEANEIRALYGTPNGSQLTIGGIRLSAGNSIGWGSVNSYDALDLTLARDAANTLAQRNGVNAQTKRIYGTYTDGSNYRRLTQTMSTGGVAEIKPEGAGTGASGNVLHISGLPTSNPGPGILWNDAGTVKVGT